MTRKLAALLFVALALAGCGATDDDTSSPVPPVISEAAELGNPAVYDRIDSLTDCAKLQEEFDTAERSHKLHRPAAE